ncbi:M16 family metallopeptidase [Sporosarcina gallistercoris]|uniref:Insulinase family protein n=1 Tax=Sporosarcina gallistercoris TaxID=2762245 RepID=A0ABR8PFY9_9BACL|nr:pitrilysin family protein [Sporosarcina gallistercoris]MBD7907082.1 insulinase family protein [Sporosarcina gallistercoris]
MVTIQTLDNGVRVVSESISHARSVSLGIWVKVGSAEELASEEGIAHFIEHMLFKGTASLTAKEIAQQFDRFGGDINAFTTKEATCFYATVLEDRAEDAARILADMLLNSKLDEQEMAKEKSVIIDELASVEDSPEEDADERLWALMYPDHAIGKPIGGTSERVQSFTRQDLVSFMDYFYTPDRIVISVAGNFNDSLLQTIGQLFGDFSKPVPKEERRTIESANFISGEGRKEKDIEQSHLFLGYPGLPLKHPDIYSLALLDSILGGTMSSRLFQEVREEKGLAYSVYSYYASHAREGAFVIGCAASPENEKLLFETVQSVIKEIIEHGVTADELSNAKEQMRGSYLIGLESTEARMHRNGNNELILGEHRSEEEIIARIQAVTAEDIAAMAKSLLGNKPAISVLSPNQN